MTFDSLLLFSYTSPSIIPYITLTKGSHARVFDTRNIVLQTWFKLQYVLNITTLSNNLIFTHKLTRNRLRSNFFTSHFLFQNLITGLAIYYFFKGSYGKKLLSSCLPSESSTYTIQTLFHHKHFINSPFYITKFMFLSLFLH